MEFKNLDELIEKLLEIQKDGKGHYKVREGYQGEVLQITIHDDFEDIFFE